VQAVVEHHLTRRRVVLRHQGLGVVHQQLRRHAAEVAECALDAVEPGRLPLVTERPHIHPARVAEGRDEQMQLAPGLALDGGPDLAEVDLQLPPRRRLEPHSRQRLRRKLAPQMRHRPLHRAQAHMDAQLARQLLAHHVRVAAVTAEPLGNPDLVPGQHARPPRPTVRRPAAGGHITLHGLAAATQLGRNPPRAPTQPVQAQHRCHLIRVPHHLSPPAHYGRRNAHLVMHSISPLLRRVAGFLVSPPEGFCMSPDMDGV